MKRSLLMIGLLAAPQLALAQEAEPVEPTVQAQPEQAQPTEAPTEVAPAPQLRLAPQPQLRPQLVQPRQLQLQVQPAAIPSAEAEDVTDAPDEAEPTTLQADEPGDQAFPEDVAADDALEQGLADGFAEDDLFAPTFAPTAEAQDAPAADEPVDAAVETAPADTAAPAEEAEAHPTNYPAMWLNFLIWAAILFFIFRKPLGTFLSTQRREIVDGLEESKRIKEAAERKHAEYTERLAHLDEELESLRKEMIQAGEAERDRIIAEAETRAARMRRDAQFLIDQQMKQLKADLTREAIEAAVKSAEELLTGQTGAADQERLAKSYLNDVEASMNGSSSARGAARPSTRHKGEVQA